MYDDEWVNEFEQWLYRSDVRRPERPVQIGSEPGRQTTREMIRCVEFAIRISADIHDMRPVAPYGPEAGWAKRLRAEIDPAGPMEPGVHERPTMRATLRPEDGTHEIWTVDMPLLCSGRTESELCVLFDPSAGLSREHALNVLYSGRCDQLPDAEPWHIEEWRAGRAIVRERMDHIALTASGQAELGFRRRLEMHLNSFAPPMGWPTNVINARSTDGSIEARVHPKRDGR